MHSHLCLGLPNSLFLLGLLIKTLYEFPFCPTRARRPAHLIILDFITLMTSGQQYDAMMHLQTSTAR